jgi:hypothetical protein
MLIPLGILAAGAGGTILAGYWAGGRNPSILSSIEKQNFANDTLSALGTDLSGARNAHSAFANSGVAGYYGGGDTTLNSTGLLATVDKFTFPADSRSTLGTGLSISRRDSAGMSNSGVAGYIGGGSGGAIETRVDKFTYSSDSRSTLALHTARYLLAATANTGTAGYFAGGLAGPTTLIDKFFFPGDSRTFLGASLSSARRSHSGMSNTGTAGYYGGGNNGSITAVVDKLAFPAETISTLGTGLSSGRRDLAGCANSAVAGYFGGGGPSTTIDKFAFPSDTRSTLGTGLSTSREGFAAMSNSGG